MTSLLQAINEPAGLVAPLVLDPLMARLAEMAGFRAGYVGGGAMGFARGAVAGLTASDHLVIIPN